MTARHAKSYSRLIFDSLGSDRENLATTDSVVRHRPNQTTNAGAVANPEEVWTNLSKRDVSGKQKPVALCAGGLVKKSLRYLDVTRHSDTFVTLQRLIEQLSRFFVITRCRPID
jgi:hypothetical protein